MMTVDGICGMLAYGWECPNGFLVALFRPQGSFKPFQGFFGESAQVGMSLDELSKLLMETHSFALLSSNPDNVKELKTSPRL
jgi:hypothetical protein